MAFRYSFQQGRASLLFSTALVGTVALCPATALAQEQEQEAAPTAEERNVIVVTATRRSTELQDTALSISALTGDQLDARSLRSTADIVALVPGIALLNAEPGGNEITIRGIGTASSTDSVVGGIVNSTTSVYLNQLPVTSTISKTPDYRFVDLERVEVLRGPQGTLYGQSAMGGVIRYMTNRPDASKFGAGIDTYVSFTKDGGTNFGIDGHVNVPIVEDKLALRAVLYAYANDGFIDVIGRDNRENANEEGTIGGRVALRWNVTDNVTFDFTYLRHDIELDSTQAISGTYAPTQFAYSDTNPLAFPYAFGAPFAETPDITPVSTNRLVAQHIQPLSEVADVYNAELLVELGAINLELILGHKDVRTQNFVEGGDRAGGSTGSFTNPTTTANAKTDTAEFRVTTDFSGSPINVIAGVYYEQTDGVIGQRAITTGAPFTSYLLIGGNLVFFTFAQPGDVTIDASRRLDFEELAFYTEVTADLADNLTVTGGYRRANVKNNYQWLFARGTLDGFFGRDPNVVQGAEEDVDLYKGNIEFKPTEDILLYVQVASGYRPGGFNVGNAIFEIPDNEFSSDSLWNYEVGMRSSWFNDRLTFNVAGYRIDWSDIQLTSNLGAPSFYTSTQNAGEARIWGVEVETSARIGNYFRLSGSYTFTDAELTAVNPTDFGTANPAFVGRALPGTARNSFSVLADWNSPISNSANLIANATFRHVGRRPGDLATTNLDAPAFDILDVRAGVGFANGVQVQVFADNVTNEIAINRREPTALPGYDIFSINRPRTIGVRASYRF